MSRHRFNHAQFYVVAGYDVAMRGHFLVIGDRTLADETVAAGDRYIDEWATLPRGLAQALAQNADREVWVYHHLRDPEARAGRGPDGREGGCLTLAQVGARLAALAIVPPAGLLAGLAADEAVGDSRTVEYPTSHAALCAARPEHMLSAY